MRYSINDSTLIAIGDAIREKYSISAETIELPLFVKSPNATGGTTTDGSYFDKTENTITETITIPGASKIRITGNWLVGTSGSVKFNSYNAYCSSVITTQTKEFVGNTITIAVTPSSSGTSYFFHFQVDGLDESGNVMTSYKDAGVQTYTPAQMATAIANIPVGEGEGGVTPEGTISITENGTHDVTNYASAEVAVPVGVFPEGTLEITENGEQDVTNYASVLVNVAATGGEDDNFIADWFNRTITELTASDLNGVTQFGDYALAEQRNLASLEIPSSVTWIGSSALQSTTALRELTLPATISKISYLAFSSAGVRNLTILKEDGIVTTHSASDATAEYGIPSYGVGLLQNIYVSGKVYEAYLNSESWGTLVDKIQPYDEYVGSPEQSSYTIELGNMLEIKLPLMNFDYTPEVNVVVNGQLNENGNTISQDEIIVEVSPYGEGLHTVSIEVTKADGYVFTQTVTINAVAEIVLGTYTVSIPENQNITYGFELNADGYYESTNKKKGNSYAYARIDISNPSGLPVYIDVINYAEANYDYGVFSKVNNSLAATNSTTTSMDSAAILHNLKSKHQSGVQTLLYEDAIGDCFITVKYVKDSSGDQNNDSLQFKVRFE